MTYRRVVPKLDAGSDNSGQVRRHAAEIARHFPWLWNVLDDLDARMTAMETAFDNALVLEVAAVNAALLEDGTQALLEDGTPMLLEA